MCKTINYFAQNNKIQNVRFKFVDAFSNLLKIAGTIAGK